MAMDSSKQMGARTIKASEFKAKCLKLMDEVAESGEEIVITKNGRPVSKLVPYLEEAGESLWYRQGKNPDTWRHRLSHACRMVRGC